MKLKVIAKKDTGYELGYILNPVKGKQLISLGIFKSDLNLNPNDVVEVKASSVAPTLNDCNWGVYINELDIISKSDAKPDSTRTILKEALETNILQMPSDCTVLSELKLISKNNIELPAMQVSFNREIPIKKLNDAKQLVYGVVYEPFDGKTVDAHGDYATAEEIEKCAHNYLENHQEISLQHEERINKLARPVESFIAPCDYKVGDETIKKGSWVMVTHVLDKALWEAVESKELDAYSIEGFGQQGPDLLKSIVKSASTDQSFPIIKKNLVNMEIDAVALVSKGANKKKFYLKKKLNKDLTMNKELAILLAKSIKDKALQAEILKAVAEEDKKDVEAEMNKPAETPKEEEKKQEIDPALLDQIVAAVLAKLPKTEEVEAGCKTEDMEKEIKKYEDNTDLDIPVNILPEIIKRATVK